MKILKFSFKNEAIWMVALSTAPLAIALLAVVIVRLLR
jgi:hypothetical protein